MGNCIGHSEVEKAGKAKKIQSKTPFAKNTSSENSQGLNTELNHEIIVLKSNGEHENQDSLFKNDRDACNYKALHKKNNNLIGREVGDQSTENDHQSAKEIKEVPVSKMGDKRQKDSDNRGQKINEHGACQREKDTSSSIINRNITDVEINVSIATSANDNESDPHGDTLDNSRETLDKALLSKSCRYEMEDKSFIQSNDNSIDGDLILHANESEIYKSDVRNERQSLNQDPNVIGCCMEVSKSSCIKSCPTNEDSLDADRNIFEKRLPLTIDSGICACYFERDETSFGALAVTTENDNVKIHQENHERLEEHSTSPGCCSEGRNVDIQEIHKVTNGRFTLIKKYETQSTTDSMPLARSSKNKTPEIQATDESFKINQRNSKYFDEDSACRNVDIQETIESLNTQLGEEIPSECSFEICKENVLHHTLSFNSATADIESTCEDSALFEIVSFPAIDDEFSSNESNFIRAEFSSEDLDLTKYYREHAMESTNVDTTDSSPNVNNETYFTEESPVNCFEENDLLQPGGRELRDGSALTLSYCKIDLEENHECFDEELDMDCCGCHCYECTENQG